MLEMHQKLKEAVNGMKKRISEGDDSEADVYMTVKGLFNYIDRGKSEIKKLRKMLDTIRDDANMSNADKEKDIETINDMIIQKARDVIMNAAEASEENRKTDKKFPKLQLTNPTMQK